MKKFLRSILIAVMIAAAAYIAVSAAGGADDPLITLSYLNSVLLPALKEDQQKQVQELNAAALEELRKEIAASGITVSGGSTSYLALEMHEGETIIGYGGAIEVLLRRGDFRAVDPIGDMLANLTKGSEAGDASELTLQNLYLVPRADGRGVKCVSGSGWVMVRGGYQVIDAAGTVIASSSDIQS